VNQSFETDMDFSPETLDRHFRFVPIVFYIARPTGNYPTTYISPNAREILGFEPAEFTSLENFWSSHIHPDDVEEVFLALGKMAEADHHILEYRFRNSTGEYRWMYDEFNLVRNPDGIPSYITGYWLDITERKQQEIALQEAKQKLEEKDRFLQHVLDNVPQRLFWKDCNGTFIGCNRAGAKSIGLGSPNEIIGKTDFDIYANHEDSDYFFRLDQGVMENGAPLFHHLMQRQLPDGKMAWLDLTKVPLHDGMGQVNGLLISHEDRTEFAIIEASLRKFKQAVEQSSSAIMITDIQGHLEYVNPAFCHTYGYEAQEVLGNHTRILKSGHTTLDEYRLMWDSILVGHCWHGEFLNRKKNGDTVWQSATISPIFDEGGKITHFVSIGDDLTERKKMEQALREGEEKYRHLVEDTSAVVYEMDPGTLEFTYVSPRVESLLGYPATDWLKENFWENHLHPDGKAAIVDRAINAMWHDGDRHFEYRMIRSDGKIIWIEDRARVFLYENGLPFRMRGIMLDITERMDATEKLFNTRQMLQLVLDHIPQRVFWKDLNSSYLGCNRAYSDDMNLASSAEIKGSTDFDHYTAIMARRYRKDDLRVIQQGQPRLEYEEPMEAHSGRGIRWLQTSKVPLHNYAGEVIGVLGMYTDITEQRALQKQLRDALRQLQTILDNAQVGIAHLEERRFIWANRQMEEMFGYKKKEIKEKTEEMLYPSHEDYEQLGNDAYPILSQGKPYETERIMRRKNGRLFWCHLRGTSISPRNPKKGTIWTLMDIDRRKQAERQLVELNDTLAQQVSLEIGKGMEKERILIQQARHAAMGEMIGNIAHQWRQPLTALGLILQNISTDFEDLALDAGALKDYTTKAMRSIRQMSSTIDDFRDFFRPNRAKTLFNVTRAARETLNLVEAALNNNNIACHLFGPEDIQCCGHKNELAQVLLNLINNAKDTLVERKIPDSDINIEVSSDGGRARITVRDNAGGIPAGAMEKIFDPYFTTKEKGTGIGLYMAKTIIERHMGGNIFFKNSENGAGFTIDIPLNTPCSLTNESREVQ